MNRIIIVFLIFISSIASGAQNILNIYIWGNYLPDEVVQQFTKETGVLVNVAEYDNNETMYAKLKASKHTGYDIIVPSSYYIDRMKKQDMLAKIDKTKLSNFKNLNPALLNKQFDPQNNYSIPYLWGSTGIAVNKRYFDPKTITKWQDLWDNKYRNQLMLLDDMRDVFSVAFLTLGYSINDSNPKHIHQAYLKIKELMPNVKIFNTDAVPNIYVDEDITIGMAWSGDCKSAQDENPNMQYIYPQDGFVIWIDSMAIVKNAPHLENAHKFIDFVLRPDIAKKINLSVPYSSPNLAATKLLPRKMQQNPMVNPDTETLKRGQVQLDISEKTLQLYSDYWEKLKVGE